MGWVWFPFVWAEVVGRNPELANMSNPRGEIIRDRYYPCAEAEDGRRFVSWQQGSEHVEDIESLCALYNEHRVMPNPERDTQEQPAYGSDAYIKGGWEQERAEWERRKENGW